MAIEDDARAMGFSLPSGNDLIKNGDNAITANALAAARELAGRSPVGHTHGTISPVRPSAGEWVDPGLVWDSFARADGALGAPPTGARSWSTAGTATLGIVSKTVQATSGTGNGYATLDVGTDLITKATITSLGSGRIGGVVAAYTSESDHLFVSLRASATDQTVTLIERRSGLYPLVTTTVPARVGMTIGVRNYRGTAQLIIDGTPYGLPVAHTRTGTRSGLYLSADDTGSTFSTFIVSEA